MWELSISCNSKFSSHLNYIFSTLDKLKGVKIYKALSEKDNVSTLSIATHKKENEVVDLVKDKIAEAIIYIEKDKYITAHSNLKMRASAGKKTFKKALVLFDFDDDKSLILEQLTLDKNINLHAFYQFRLRHLKKKWEDLVTITNQENSLLGGTDVLLGFLIESIKPTDRKVFVDKNTKNFILLNEAGEQIDEGFVSKNITDEVDLVTNLIVLSPRKINILCKDNISKETYNLINYIFNGKVK